MTTTLESSLISSNASLLERRNVAVSSAVSTAHPIFTDRASGSWLWDVDGRAYLDFVGGIGVLNVGHNHPRVVEAVRVQLERYSHTAFQVAMYEPYVRLAERLNHLVPTAHPMKTALFTTGVEATENAIKIARGYTNRPAVIAFRGAFHGRTLMGMSLTGMSRPYKQNFGPFAPEVYHTPYPYEYRGWSAERALEALHELFETQVAPERVAAIVIEPQLGDGGFVPAPLEFMQALRRICTEHGIVMIADEVQTGFGRTARMFGFEHARIEPDLIPFAKSIAGGLPLSGVIGRAELMDAPEPGGLGGTYAGNPLACAAALAVLDVFETEGLLNRAAIIGQALNAALEQLRLRYQCVGDVRGLGAMNAIELVSDRATKTPDADLTTRVLAAARHRGLLLIKCGTHRNVIRCLAPLTSTDSDVTQGIERLNLAFEDVFEKGTK